MKRERVLPLAPLCILFVPAAASAFDANFWKKFGDLTMSRKADGDKCTLNWWRKSMRFKYLAALILPVLLVFGVPARAGEINVEKIKRQILSECGSGAKAGPKFPTSADFDGDGKPDYIFDYADANGCLSFCGSAGCTVDIYLSSRGDKPVFSDNLRAWSVRKGQGKDLLELGLHGSACGRVGAAECRRTLSWNGQKFVPIR